MKRTSDWGFHVHYATLDLSGPYDKVFTDALPWVTQIADPFHFVKLANQKLDECRRRVQQELFGHRGHKLDPLYRARRLLTMAAERPNEKSHEKVMGLLRAGDPRGGVTACYNAKEAVRELYPVPDYDPLNVYWTYENWVHKYARVHRADCAHCNDGRGSHGADLSHAGRWLGPYEQFVSASRASEYEALPCGHCSPIA